MKDDSPLDGQNLLVARAGGGDAPEKPMRHAMPHLRKPQKPPAGQAPGTAHRASCAARTSAHGRRRRDTGRAFHSATGCALALSLVKAPPGPAAESSYSEVADAWQIMP